MSARAVWHTVCAVACSFFGVRKADGEQTIVLKPLHLIAVALISVFVFVLGLIAFVHYMVAK